MFKDIARLASDPQRQETTGARVESARPLIIARVNSLVSLQLDAESAVGLRCRWYHPRHQAVHIRPSRLAFITEIIVRRMAKPTTLTEIMRVDLGCIQGATNALLKDRILKFIASTRPGR